MDSQSAKIVWERTQTQLSFVTFRRALLCLFKVSGKLSASSLQDRCLYRRKAPPAATLSRNSGRLDETVANRSRGKLTFGDVAENIARESNPIRAKARFAALPDHDDGFHRQELAGHPRTNIGKITYRECADWFHSLPKTFRAKCCEQFASALCAPFSMRRLNAERGSIIRPSD